MSVSGGCPHASVTIPLSGRFSVTREKEILELPLAEIVVGDIAKFKYGNTLPVDGILVQVCECGCECE